MKENKEIVRWVHTLLNYRNGMPRESNLSFF